MDPYQFVFDDEDRAKRFCERLALYLTDIAVFRKGCEVEVLDGSEQGQRERIYTLYRTSDDTFVIPIPRKT